MKIDEPKTPYVGNYDPQEDEEDATGMNTDQIMVDEPDKQRKSSVDDGQPGRQSSSSGFRKEDEIPGLELGDSAHAMQIDPGEKRVVMDEAMSDDVGQHGEEEETSQTREEREKHRRFEEMRKRHYEMREVKDMLG